MQWLRCSNVGAAVPNENNKTRGCFRLNFRRKRQPASTAAAQRASSIAITKMQALLLPSRLPPPLLRQRGLPAVASLASHPLNGATLPTGRLYFGRGEAAPRRLTVAAAASSSSSGPLYPTPPPTEQTIERAKLEQVLPLFYPLWSMDVRYLARAWSRVLILLSRERLCLGICMGLLGLCILEWHMKYVLLDYVMVACIRIMHSGMVMFRV